MMAILRALLVLLVLAVVAGGVIVVSITSRGLSTRVPPSKTEEFVALTMRRLATPRAMRTERNPVEPTEQVIAEARAHFADHCAICHGNNGSGDTEIGRNLYPPAPDMREARTQDLSDGELFSIIEHGIRLTGMPAWSTGTPEGERDSWGLVQFIRRLPSITPEEIMEMEALNPKSPAEFREEEEIRRFLAGEDEPPAPSGPPSHRDPHP